MACKPKESPMVAIKEKRKNKGTRCLFGTAGAATLSRNII
jgi:hypothetical protein